jgi:hypothetical protein
MKIPCDDKNEKLLVNKPSILFSQHSNFGNKIQKIVRMMKRWATRISFVCSLVEFTHTLGTNALEPWPMSFPMISSKKQGTMRFYKPWPKGYSVNHP